MKKALSILLALIICFSLCACNSGDVQEQPSNEVTPNENTEISQTPVDDEFISKVCGTWNKYSGVLEMDYTLEFRSDGTCKIGEEELIWDAMFKTKPHLDAPKEYINIYRHNEPIYEAYISTDADYNINLIISEFSESNAEILANGYKKISAN